MDRIVFAAISLALALAATVHSQQPTDFAHQIVPILRKHCVECHGGKEAKGGFSLNTRELMLESEAVVPGKPRESRLLDLVTSSDREEQMPPKDRARLTAVEIDQLRKWVEKDVLWDAGFTFVQSRYEPPLRPRKPELPPIVNGQDHPVDRILNAHFVQHKIAPTESTSDAEFLRRVSLDITGLLPEPDPLAAFVADPSSDKRARLIRDLLGNDIAYAEHWLSFWNDLLRNDYSGTGFITGGRKQITSWLYESLVNNRPYDEFARELIAPSEQSEGFIQGIRWRGNVNASQSVEIQFAQNIGQAFLGINIKCASCHDSFIGRWTLEETYGLAQIFAKEPLILHRCDKSTGKNATAAWIFPELGQVDATADQSTRLKQLASLMTHPENGRFTRTIVNRIWHRLMGRGIVHPVDAMDTEPWNADLLDYLANHLSSSGYDLKKTIELICTSQVYQSRTPVAKSSIQAGAIVFAGPVARRMTAEQFMDTVWQVTAASPKRIDAPVLRFKQPGVTSAASSGEPKPKWIWSQADAGSSAPPGEKITFRRKFDLKIVPDRAVAAISCDNEFTLYVNGRELLSRQNWKQIELLNLQPHLKEGLNDLVVVAKNAGDQPNPAGLLFEARLLGPKEAVEIIGTDATWQWTKLLPDAKGRFARQPDDWQKAAAVKNPEVWNQQIGSPFVAMLTAAADTKAPMIRASLMKNDAFMTALGRPTRDQIVSMRPSELTTLEAIDLANGQTFADAIARGAEELMQRFHLTGDTAASKSKQSLVSWLYAFALSRAPTSDEETLALDLLGEKPSPDKVEDLLWSVFMLPEFQLVR